MRDRLTNVISTLQQLDIQSTYNNMDRLLGCIQELMRIRDTLPAETNAEVQEDGGKADA